MLAVELSSLPAKGCPDAKRGSSLSVLNAIAVVAGSNAVLKFPKSSGRQLVHRGKVTATVTAPGVSHPQLELQGKFTESMKIVPLGSSAVSQSEREVFRWDSLHTLLTRKYKSG